jgi:tol-pal system protein YbgF
MRKPVSLAIVMAFGLLAPSAAYARADKAQQLLMAEIRMLQENQQQLRQVLDSVTEALKALNTRMDNDANRTQKTVADQKLVIDSVAETSRILREKSDETNVKLSTITQELQSLRQSVASMPTPSLSAPPPTGLAPTGDPNEPSPAAANNPPPNISPTAMWDKVYAVYTSGQFDLAAEGFQSYIRTFPKSPQADDAQLYIGHSLYGAGKYAEAATALQRVITDYPSSDSVPAAYYKLGLSYEALKQLPQARQAFETVIKNHATSSEATLARQALVRVQGKEE